MADRTEHALSFGPAASEYDARRPSYPTVAVDWALGPGPLRVVDVGAGTGILTRVLLRLGHHAIPVEPDPAMRERLVATTPVGTALAGSAEAIPLRDGSVDAVVAGQAYHWFDRDRAHPEIARVLRPDGVFAPIWNIRDESVPWVAELSRIVDGARQRPVPGDWPSGEFEEPMDDRTFGELFGPLFGAVERHVFRHCVRTTADGLVALVRTRSYYLGSPPQRRAETERAVRELAAGLPQVFDVPYITAVYRARRR
jgi:SAM-dependent methyltransferase